MEKYMNIRKTLFFILTFPISLPMAILLTVSRKAVRWGRHLPHHPRFINWVWATWRAFFWLPCPICHINFGGHEWGTGHNSSLMTDPGSGWGVCWRCESIAGERNKELYKKYGMTVRSP